MLNRCVARYAFEPKWKETLVCTSSHGQIIFEMPMGRVHVLFPSEARWNEIVVFSLGP